ncbi:MAG: hypothetical protein ABSC03_10220 [Verrucomicrobiota bacterium]|jgi:hypothetical protein
MRRTLQLLALLLLLSTGVLWLATGANRGWTKTSVPVKHLDEVTGIEGIEYRPRFVPGLDFLGAVGFGAAALGGFSLFCRNPKTKEHTQP